MFDWRIDPNVPLELLNGSGTVVEIFFLVWMIRYLKKETTACGLTVSDWLHYRLPPSMNFVVAVFVFDSGVALNRLVIWVWRRFFGAGDFGVMQLAMIGLGGLLILVGGLCKIRAVTKPYRGDGPWLRALGAVLLFVLATLLTR